MSKGNSGILSKHQAKVSCTGTGVLGPQEGFEVLKEVVVKARIDKARPSNVVRICARTANDTKWYEIGIIEGNEMVTLHVASWDYITFECTQFSSLTGTNVLISSGYFNDGMFAVDSINDMKNEMKDSLLKLTSEVCDIKRAIETINRQIEIITDHEECEVK